MQDIKEKHMIANLTDALIVIDELYNQIKELQEREDKLVIALKTLKNSNKIRELYPNEYEKRGYLMFVEATLQSLGIQE